MAVNQPPIQELTTDHNGRFPLVWIRWFRSIYEETKAGFSGTFVDNTGKTVTVVNGKITDVS